MWLGLQHQRHFYLIAIIHTISALLETTVLSGQLNSRNFEFNPLFLFLVFISKAICLGFIGIDGCCSGVSSSWISTYSMFPESLSRMLRLNHNRIKTHRPLPNVRILPSSMISRGHSLPNLEFMVILFRIPDHRDILYLGWRAFIPISMVVGQ